VEAQEIRFRDWLLKAAAQKRVLTSFGHHIAKRNGIYQRLALHSPIVLPVLLPARHKQAHPKHQERSTAPSTSHNQVVNAIMQLSHSEKHT
jgi:hypothetical protein